MAEAKVFVSNTMVPLGKPYLDSAEEQAMVEVLRSGWLTHGPKNKEFENNFAQYLGVNYALTVNSCASSLQLALMSANINGEVLVPSFTFVASANTIVNAGATPVFVDINYDTCNIDLADARAKITPQTQAIMVVHFAGQSCNMAETLKLAEEYKLKIIEDSAEALGSKFQNRLTGTFGIGCFSFFPTKNITTGEGGVLCTNDPEIYSKAKSLAGHGITSSTFDREKSNKPWLRAASYAGFNFRMSNLLAAIGVEQMKKLEEMNNLRRSHAQYLNENLKNFTNKIDLPVEAPDCYHVYQMYTIKMKDSAKRDAFIKGMTEKGIGVSVHFDPPVHLQPYYNENELFRVEEGKLPITEKISSSIVTLPMYPGLTKPDLDLIIKSIEKTLEEI